MYAPECDYACLGDFILRVVPAADWAWPSSGCGGQSGGAKRDHASLESSKMTNQLELLESRTERYCAIITRNYF